MLDIDYAKKIDYFKIHSQISFLLNREYYHRDFEIIMSHSTEELIVSQQNFTIQTKLCSNELTIFGVIIKYDDSLNDGECYFRLKKFNIFKD